MKTNKIMGVKVDFNINYDYVIGKIDEFVSSDSPHYIWTVNPEFIMAAQKNLDFKKVLNVSDISTTDGVGTILARRYFDLISELPHNFLFPLTAFIKGTVLGLRTIFGFEEIEERVTGIDLIYKICENASEKGQTVFFLGGWEKDFWGNLKLAHGDIANRAAKMLKVEYPNLKIIGATSDFKRSTEHDEATLSYIHGEMAKHDVKDIDIMFVAYGHSHQERWIVENLHKIPAKVGIGLGGTFDYVAYFQRRSPHSFTKRNYEWLYRFLTQPWRLKRTLMAFPVFPLFIFYSSLTSRNIPESN